MLVSKRKYEEEKSARINAQQEASSAYDENFEEVAKLKRLVIRLAKRAGLYDFYGAENWGNSYFNFEQMIEDFAVLDNDADNDAARERLAERKVGKSNGNS